MKTNFATEANAAITKLAPVGIMASADVAGWGPQDWMYALTGAYVVIQALYLLWKWYREWRAKKA